MRRIYLPLILLAAAIIGSLSGGARTGDRRDTARIKDKAAYLFLEGVAALNDGAVDRAYLLLDRASELDPTDIDIAAFKGEILYATGIGDSAQYAESYEAIRRRYLNNPADADNGSRFANLAIKLSRYEDVENTYRLLTENFPGRPDFALNYAWVQAVKVVDGDTAGLDSAMAIYDRLEAGMGSDATLISHRIRALSLTRDTVAIAREINHLFSTAPADPEINLIVGSSYDALGMPDSAIRYYDRACELDSTFGQAYLMRAEFYMSEGDSARYDTEVFRALESTNLEFEPKFEILTNYVRALYGDTSRTASIRNLFDRMELIHPAEPDLHSLYGSFLAVNDSFAAAAEQFGYAVDLQPEDASNWQLLMQTSISAGDTIAAIDAGRRAIPLFPDNMLFTIYTAAYLSLIDRPAEAIEVLDSFDTSSFNNNDALSDLHQARGDNLYKLGLRDSAFAEYERSLALNPMNAGTQNNAAYFRAVDGIELDKALQLAEKAVQSAPHNPTYIDTYAWVLFKRKDYPAAKLQIDLALSMYSAEVDSIIGDSDSVLIGDSTDVETEIAEVVEEVFYDDLPSSEVYDHAGDIYFMNGEPEQAVVYWEKALALDPNNEKIKKKVTHKTYFFE